MTAEAKEQARPRLAAGEFAAGTHDGAPVIRWTLGTGGVTRGLTVAGIAAAAAATGEYLAGLDPLAVPRLPQVRIGVSVWEIPLVPADAAAVMNRMTVVVNAEGAIGQLA